ncbi:hypothetical protein NKI95_18195 [Mesorhizobium sp. M0306]|uniref:hypothetical protein n=1 Tax=Mesorhizobium sp. M0306 TaxID=2956932 RepID=UPI003334AF7D
MATMKFLAWQRSKILSEAQEAGGRLGRSLTLTLDDLGDSQPALQGQVPVLFPAASDVGGLRSAVAIRHLAPKPSTPDAETTKFVHVDFHEADLPWRYTPNPSAAGSIGLKPWMVLLVGTTDELGAEGGFVTRLENKVLEDHDLAKSHLWAHVQTEGAVTFSRLLSPRRLVPLRDHVAVIVPTFTATGAAMWQGAQRNFEALPAFFSWRFQAAEEGDFETLATALQLRPSGGLGIADLRYRRPVTNVDAKLTLGGAITSLKNHPSEPVQVKAARDDLDRLNDELADVEPPEIVPPPPLRDIMQLPNYGGLWKEDTSTTQWTKSMNDDPRHRGVAGLGLWMGVVEQESLMDAAVKQAGALQDAAQRVGHLAFGLDAARRLWRRRLPDVAELELRLFGPAMGRMLTDGQGTLLGYVTSKTRTLDSAIFSSAAQRLLRNGTARSRFSNGRIDRAAFLAAANEAPERAEKAPPGLPHVDAVARALGEQPLEDALGLPPFDERLEEILQKFAGQPVDDERIRDFVAVVNDAFGLQCGELIEHFFSQFQPFLDRSGRPTRFFDRETMLAAIESCLAGNLRGESQEGGLGAALPRPEEPDGRRPAKLGDLAAIVGGAIDPTQAMPPAWVRVKATIIGLDLATLAPPEAPIGLDYPTWTLVNRHEREWLLPGAGAIPPNSIVSLQTNPTFVDAFMVGINTQFLSEMRWRNLPAPRVSTPLRMFWGYINHETAKREADIRPVVDWPSKPFGEPGADDVGDLSHQAIKPGDTTGKQDLVIAFRTALFRRYPSTLVYLVRPLPGDDPDTLLQAPPNFADAPADRNQRRYFGPIFFGQMEPDLVFFAFDVDPQTLDQFWLVLDEPPSELRFRNDQGLAWPNSAKFAERTIDKPTRVAISGAELERQAQNG